MEYSELWYKIGKNRILRVKPKTEKQIMKLKFEERSDWAKIAWSEEDALRHCKRCSWWKDGKDWSI